MRLPDKMMILFRFLIDHKLYKLCLIHIPHNIIFLHQKIFEFILDDIE